MASNTMIKTEDVYISSDDENLSVYKRKAEAITIKSEKRSKYSDSDDEPLLPSAHVTVEVEVLDNELQEYNAVNKRKKDKTKVKRTKKPVKSKRQRTHVCSECNAIFRTAVELKTHSYQHQEQTRHRCEFCGRYFSKAFSLKMHRQMHLEDKREKCPICGVKFSLKVNLGRHMIIHEKTEKCEKCTEKFHTKDQLEEHIKTHDNETPGEITIKMEKVPVATIDSNQPEIKTDADSDESEGIKLEIDSESEKDTVSSLVEVSIEYDETVSRENLTHPIQCAIVNKMHKGRSVADICRLYNLKPDVVNEIWEDREKYTLHKKTAKKTIKYMNTILDTRIVEWFQNQKANNIQVTGQMLQDTAEAFAKETGFVAFNGSRKWLDRFKKKYNISFRGTPSKRDYNNVTTESKWKTQFLKEQWCDARLGIDDEDIYTGDEVGVYYNPSKARIKKLGGKKFIQGHVKDRLSIFVCSNVSGSDKKKLLVCGSEDPLLHSYRDPDTLPVTYIRHAQAHFTTNMFEEYVKYWNRELQLNNRKALLILDRATIHSKLQLSHLKLVFVPWKASTALMPVKYGIYSRFRDEFRKLILEEKAMNVLRGVDRNLTCLEALNMLEKAWERTPAEVITKGFLLTGYDVQSPPEDDKKKAVLMPKVSENDEEVLCQILKECDVESYYTDLSALDMFLTVDEEQLTGQGTNCSVFGGNHKVIEPTNRNVENKEEILQISTEKPETHVKEDTIKKSRALQDLEIVRRYLQANNTSYETYCSFMDIEKFLINSANYNC